MYAEDMNCYLEADAPIVLAGCDCVETSNTVQGGQTLDGLGEHCAQQSQRHRSDEVQTALQHLVAFFELHHSSGARRFFFGQTSIDKDGHVHSTHPLWPSGQVSALCTKS